MEMEEWMYEKLKDIIYTAKRHTTSPPTNMEMDLYAIAFIAKNIIDKLDECHIITKCKCEHD